MPPRAKQQPTEPTLVKVLVQKAVSDVSWVNYPVPGWFPSRALAYGWSDGTVTWKETRD